MERDEVGTISKKRRIDSEVTGDIPNQEGDGSSKIVETQSPKAKSVDTDAVYRLYFVGSESDEFGSAGYGVAICDQTDKLLFEFKERISDIWMGNKEVEIRALIRGLRESLDLGIRKLVIYCQEDQIYKNIISGKGNFTKKYGRYKPKEKRVLKELMEEVGRLREKFASSEANLVAYNDIKFACELASEARAPEISSGHGDYDDDPDWATTGCGCDGCGFDSPPPVDYVDYYTL